MHAYILLQIKKVEGPLSKYSGVIFFAQPEQYVRRLIFKLAFNRSYKSLKDLGVKIFTERIAQRKRLYMSSFMHHRSDHDRRSTLLGWRSSADISIALSLHLLGCFISCSSPTFFLFLWQLIQVMNFIERASKH